MKKIGIIMTVALATMFMSCSGGGSGKSGSEASSSPAQTEAAKPAKKVIVARLAVKAGQEQAFIEVAAKLIEATHKEPGNLFYALYQSPVKPTEFIFYEEYKDQAAFDAHASSAPFAAFSEGIKDIIDGELLVEQF
jgi:quinol monooxygenase YgiN